MKSTTYLNTLLTLGLGAITITPTLAQDDLEDEQSGVCGFTLQANNLDIYRDNDWRLSNSNDNGRLTRAQFYITDATSGRLYGGSGERCGFDPYLTCDDDTDENTNRQPFTILSNNSLTFSSQSLFYLCDRTSFTSTDPDDQDDEEDRLNPDDLAAYPYIYPPIGTTSNRARNYENCTGVALVASGCQEGSGVFTVSPSAAVVMSEPTGSASGTGSGGGTATGAVASASAPVPATGAAERVELCRGIVWAGVVGAAMGFAWL